ncbi:MAG: hypothetical protein ACRCZI_05785 [Cetobacterium sp.]
MHCCLEKIEQLEKRIKNLEVMLTDIDFDNEYDRNRFARSKILKFDNKKYIAFTAEEFDGIHKFYTTYDRNEILKTFLFEDNEFNSTTTVPLEYVDSDSMYFVNDKRTECIELSIEYSQHIIERHYEFSEFEIDIYKDDEQKNYIFEFKDIKGCWFKKVSSDYWEKKEDLQWYSTRTY